MVFSRSTSVRPEIKQPVTTFQPPAILPIATMDDLEAQVDTLLATYLHNLHTELFHTQATKLIQQCPEDLAVITEKTINSFKILSRVHGLPLVMTPHLLAPLRDPSADVQFRLKIAHTLKYCQEKSNKFLEGAQVLPILEECERNLGGSSPSFLERNLLSSLVQVVAIVVGQYEDATMTLLRRSFGMLNAEQKMDVRSLLELKGLWDTPLHATGDEASMRFIGSETAKDYDDMTFLSKNLKGSCVTTVTKDQQIDTVISEESEKSEMLSFKIQCTPWTTQEETTSINVQREASGAPRLPSSYKNSWWWENLSRKLTDLNWSINNVKYIYEKARSDNSSLTLEELEYLAETFYSAWYTGQEKREMDKIIVQTLKEISSSVQLPTNLLEKFLDKASRMYGERMGFLVDVTRATYDNNLKYHLLEDILEVAGYQCIFLNAEKFYPTSCRLKEIDQQVRRSFWVLEELRGRLRDKILTIFQHQASEEDMPSVVKDALNLLMDDQTYDAALDFIVTRVRTRKLLTTEDKVVPAAINVLKNNKYSSHQRQSAFQLLHLHNSNPQAPLLTSFDIICILRSYGDWARAVMPPFILSYLNKNPSQDDWNNQVVMNLIWRVLSSCCDHIHDDLQNEAHFLLAVEKMAALTLKYKQSNRHDSIATLTAKNLDKIAKSLKVKALIYQDGSVSDVTASPHNEPHMPFSTIVAKILADLCTANTWTRGIVEEVSQTLNDDDEDKLTRIYCSEYLFKVKTFHQFSLQELEVLQKCTEDAISDIRIYSRVAYTHSLKDLELEVIPPHHVYHLPSIYAFAPLRFGNDDFTDEINGNILAAFNYVKDVVEFNIEMLNVLSHELDKLLQTVTLDRIGVILSIVEGTLRNSNAKKNMTGESLQIVISIIEKIFVGLDDFNAECCCLMLNLLENGYWISTTFAKKCVEITSNVGVTNDYIHCLWIADDLQDLPQRIFNDFHIELVGKRFFKDDRLPELHHHEEAVTFLHKQLESGRFLSQCNIEAIRQFCFNDTLTELALDCLISACTNGQHLDFTIVEVAFTADCCEKKVKLAKILVQNHEQLPEGYKTTLFKKKFDTLSTHEDRSLFDLVATMIQYNYWIPRRVIDFFDKIAMAAIRATRDSDVLPTDLVIPALACLMERRLIYEKRLPEWKDELLQYSGRSLKNLDLALDAILKLPTDLITNFDIDKLIIQVLNPSAPQSSRHKLYKAQRGNSLYQVLLLFTGPDDIDDLTSAICVYIANEIRLELPQHVCCRLEDDMLSSPEVSFRILDQLQAVPEESSKQQLKKIADVTFLVHLSTTDDEIRENCHRVMQVLNQFGVNSAFMMKKEPETIGYDRECEQNSSTANNFAVEITWKSLSKLMEEQPVQMSHLSDLAMQVSRHSRNFSPSQIQTFIQFSFQMSTEQEPTLELVKLWYHFLCYEPSADVRSVAFTALAATRKIQGSQLASFIDEILWDHIVYDKIRLLYKEIYGHSHEVHLSDHEFYIQLAHTLYSLDHWDLKLLTCFSNPDDWIPQLIISDLIERFATTDEERAELHVNIQKFLQGGGNLNTLKTFVCSNVPGAAEGLKISFSNLIELCNDCLRITGEFHYESLKELIQLALSEKIKSKFLAAPPSNMIALLADLLLESADDDYTITSNLISVIRSIQRPQEIFRITQVFGEMTSQQKAKCLDYLKNSGRTHSASELTAVILTQNLLNILNVDFTSDQGRSVEKSLRSLFQRGFSPEILLKLFNIHHRQQTMVCIDIIDNILHQLHQYRLDYHAFASHLDQIMNSDSTESLALQISKVIQTEIHSESLHERMRNRHQLLQELRQPLINPHARLPQTLESMMEGLMGRRIKHPGVRSWSKRQILQWAQDQGHRATTEQHVAAIYRAFKLHKDWDLTPVQVLSILIALEKSSESVLLQQVSTGTGKSAIIAAVAVVNALKGQKVDIYTSSPVLAERDAKEWTPFYELFGLTCSHNVEKGSCGYGKGTKNCYHKDIVYGDMSQFQFDALKTFYSGLETCGNRGFGFALVDEVDSMCIDDSSRLARLSSTLPGMDLLHIVYQEIWNQLRLINSSMMLLDGKIHFTNKEEGVEVVTDLEKFVKKKLVDFINSSIVNPTEGFKLPPHLRSYAKIQAENWADSAITALEFHENEHYVVDEGKVKPVEFMTTGVIQSTTNWNNGLHPFLQIKHSLRVTPETVTTNFMSNREILSRYGNNVIGFSGTLGSEKSKEVLQQAYNAESIIIPEMYIKRFYRLGDIVPSSKIDWTNHIVYNALHEASKKRGVLVICQTIKEARQIANEIRRANSLISNSEIYLSIYVRNDQGQENRVERVNPGTIIVATNLGTRGMDLKASDVEDYGGLHVILTYLPDSLRVEEQAFGRTSRQGSRGTGQLIVMEDSIGISEQISDMRDIREGERLEKFVVQELPVIKLKDQLFTKFCTRYSEIQKSLRYNSLLHSWTAGIRRMTGYDSLSQHDYAVLQAIEERWALFLKKIDDGARKFEAETGSFQEYEERAMKDYQRLEVTFLRNYRDLSTIFGNVDNCFYWVRCGNELYQRDGKFSQSAAQALEYFDRAARYDVPIAPALIGKAVANLKSDHTWQHKEESLKNLEHAQKILTQESLQYRRCQVLESGRPGCANSDLHKQLENKIQLVQSYLHNVTQLIDVVSKSLRRVHVEMSTLEGESFTTTLQPGTQIPAWGRPSSNVYGLKFHDLTMRNDINTIDQATKTINEAFSYDNICPSVSFTIKVCPEFKFDDFKDELIGVEIFIDNLVDFSGIEYVHLCTRAARLTLKVSGTPALVSNALSLPLFANKNVEFSYELQEQDGRWCKTSKKFTVIHGNNLNWNLNCEIYNIIFDISLSDRGLDDLFAIKNLLFSIEISEIDIEKLKGGGWNSLLNHFDVSFITLKTSDRSKAILNVKNLRSRQVNFVLEFSELTSGHVRYLWEKCDCSQEIVEQKYLDLMSKRLPDPDLGPMISRGMELLPQFAERKFVPWKSLITMGAIGGAQIVLGLTLVSTIIGSEAGLALASEGIFDLIMAAVDGRDFEWTEYGKRKVVSLTLSSTMLGWKGMKNGLKGLKSLVQPAEEQIVTIAAKKGVGAGKNMSKLCTITTKEALSQATATVVYRQLTQAYTSLSKFSFEQIRDHLFLKVTEYVRIEMEEMCEDLARFFALESMRGFNQSQKKLKNWISKIPKSNTKIIMNTISAAQQFCNVLQKFYASEHLETAATCFKLMSVAIAAIGGLTAILTSVKCICQYVHSCISEEISKLSIPTILSFTLTKQEANRATELFTFTNPPDFDVREMGRLNVHMSAEAFDLLERVTIEREMYNNLKGTFSGDSEEKVKFIGVIAEYITSLIIKTANKSLWSPGIQDRFAKKLLENAVKRVSKKFQGDNNPPENTDGGMSPTVNEETTDHNALNSNLSAEVEMEVVNPARQTDERSVVRDVEMEKAIRWVSSRNPRKASEFLRRV